MDGLKTVDTRDVSSVILPSVYNPKKFVYVHSMKNRKWSLPMGKLDPFEHPEEGAVREILEEVGTTAVLECLIGIFPLRTPSGNSRRIFVYGGRIEESSPQPQRKEGIDEVGEFSLGEVRELHNRGLLIGRASLLPLEEYVRGVRYPLGVIHPTIHDLQQVNGRSH
jgi:8-oxo-dGTP pyrophosphatase MutT (NUDIX family)